MPRPEPTVHILAIAAPLDSTVKLAKFALGAIDGTIQLPQVRSARTTVSTHYTRTRRGGGQTEVAVMVGLSRPEGPSAESMTYVELRAFALDMAQELTAAQRRSRFPATPLSQNAPALRRPRAITPVDTADFLTLEVVLEAFLQAGARRSP